MFSHHNIIKCTAIFLLVLFLFSGVSFAGSPSTNDLIIDSATWVDNTFTVTSHVENLDLPQGQASLTLYASNSGGTQGTQLDTNADGSTLYTTSDYDYYLCEFLVFYNGDPVGGDTELIEDLDSEDNPLTPDVPVWFDNDVYAYKMYNDSSNIYKMFMNVTYFEGYNNTNWGYVVSYDSDYSYVRSGYDVEIYTDNLRDYNPDYRTNYYDFSLSNPALNFKNVTMQSINTMHNDTTMNITLYKTLDYYNTFGIYQTTEYTEIYTDTVNIVYNNSYSMNLTPDLPDIPDNPDVPDVPDIPDIPDNNGTEVFDDNSTTGYLNTTWISSYKNTINESIESVTHPINDTIYYIGTPIITVSDYTNEISTTLNNTQYDNTFTSSIIRPFFEGLPSKIQIFISYKLLLMIILLLLNR